MFHFGLRLVLFGILAAPGLAAAADATFCEDYARQAVSEATLAERLQCRFRGFHWVKDVETHRAWCLGAQKSVVQAEAASRAKDIRLCLCEWYAAQAVSQAAANEAGSCDFTGPRWSPDKSAHYRWCVLSQVPLATLESEVETRKELLAACANGSGNPAGH
jgi:hypothetical protein